MKYVNLIIILMLMVSMVGCTVVTLPPSGPDGGYKGIKPPAVDGPGMEYKDADYRTDYANILDFDSYDGQPMFAVAFLGYGDRMDFRNTYVEGIFGELSENISHLDYEGDEWYLVVPRYKEDVDIKDTTTGDVYTIYGGEAFTIKCNVSDIYPNIEISTEQNLSGHIFSPQMSGEGRLVANPDVHDITDYTVTQ